MPDREKIIKEFEEICGYTMRPHEFRVLNDVLTLLKEQEPVKPHEGKDLNESHWDCGNCGYPLWEDEYYCAHCGRKIDWQL